MWILSPILAALASLYFCVGYAVLFHFKRFKRTLLVFWMIWMIGLFLYLLIGWNLLQGEIPPLASGALLYFAASYFLAQLYFQVERGCSMRLLVEIQNSPQGKLTQKQLEAIYPFDLILDKRLKPSTETGFFKTDGKHYELSLKGRRTAKLFRLVKWFLRLDSMA